MNQCIVGDTRHCFRTSFSDSPLSLPWRRISDHVHCADFAISTSPQFVSVCVSNLWARSLSSLRAQWQLHDTVSVSAATPSQCLRLLTVGYLSFGPIEKNYIFCDLSVREKDWRAASQAFECMHNTLSHRLRTYSRYPAAVGLIVLPISISVATACARNGLAAPAL